MGGFSQLGTVVRGDANKQIALTFQAQIASANLPEGQSSEPAAIRETMRSRHTLPIPESFR